MVKEAGEPILNMKVMKSPNLTGMTSPNVTAMTNPNVIGVDSPSTCTGRRTMIAESDRAGGDVRSVAKASFEQRSSHNFLLPQFRPPCKTRPPPDFTDNPATSSSPLSLHQILARRDAKRDMCGSEDVGI